MRERLLEREIRPATLVANELEAESAIRSKVAWLAGSLAMNEAVNLNINQPFNSLYDGIKQAALGDPLAYQLVQTNVTTDVIERTIKAGFVLPKVHLDIGLDGSLSQNGQGYLTIQANSLAQTKHHPIMRARTEAEARNAFRIEELARRNTLEDYSVVVFSRAENLADCGFFTETMSCAIQVTSKDGQGVAIESAFVAGKDSQGNLHDQSAVEAIYNHLAGVDISGLSPAEIIDKPLLIPNFLIPNGVIDLVKLYDDVCNNKFFGLDKPREDYLSYRDKCLLQQDKYLGVSLKIIQQLIAEAGSLKTTLEATQRLNQLSERYTLAMALDDHSIDPRVFGLIAANHLIEARLAMDQGLIAIANNELKLAIKTAKSSSCPMTNLTGNVVGEDEDEDEYGSLVFICSNGHVNERPPHILIDKCQHEGCDAIVTC